MPLSRSRSISRRIRPCSSARSARFGYPEVKIGFVPAMNSSIDR